MLSKKNISILLILLSVSSITAYTYFYNIERPNVEKKIIFHNQIINGYSLSPYAYRVLIPFTAQGLTTVFSGLISYEKAFLLAFAVIDFVSIFALLAFLYVLFTEWFSSKYALIGVLFVSLSLSVALRDHFYQPWSLPEAAMFVLGMIFSLKRKFIYLLFLIPVATLNRETALFIIPVFFFGCFKFRNSVLLIIKDNAALIVKTLLLILIWLSVFAGLRILIGNVQHIHSLNEILLINLDPHKIFKAILNTSLFFGAFGLFALAGFSNSPDFLKRTSKVIPIYILFFLVFGIWEESRLLMILYPFFIPMGLSFLQNQFKNIV